MKTSVVINTEFAGIHKWPNAPDSVYFLRNPHRHVFKVTVSVLEDHSFGADERETEFILLKAFVTSFFPRLSLLPVCPHTGCIDLGAMSCENIALQIFTYLTTKGYTVVSVSVMEDGENGARLEE